MLNTTNKQIKKSFFFILHFALIGLLGYLFIGLFSPSAYATGFSLAIYPPLIQIAGKPSANIKSQITIKNLSNEAIDLDILFEPFSASINQNGEVNYIPISDEYALLFNNVQVVDQENPTQNLTLAPKQEKNLFLKIQIPENSKQEDYYFSVQFISKPNTINNNLNYSQILGGVATNILLSVGSRENSKGVIKEFSAPVFLKKGPVPFNIKVENTDKHFITAQGTVIIKNLFGQIVGKVDVLPMNMLKDSTRSIKLFWSEFFLLGVYTATLNMSLSDQGPIFTKSISFFAIPAQAAIAMLTFLIIGLFIYNRIKKQMDSQV